MNFILKVQDLLLPPRCLSCHHLTTSPESLCATCWKELSFIPSHKCCKICGHPFEEGYSSFKMCGSCLKTPPPFAKARSLLFYNALSKKLILQFKHFDALYLAKAFAKWLYATHKSLFEQQDFILPVPLHKKRLLFRRYNQSALIAKELSRLSHIPYNPFLLIRKKNTPSQGTLSKKNRQKNVKNAFETPPKFLKNVKKSNILLIDDVYTTGSTVSVCALSLQKAGVSEITVLTVARATPYFDLK